MKKWIIQKISTRNIIDDDYVDASPSERFLMVWDITLDAWAFKGDNNAEQRLQRNVTNLTRRKR